MRISKTVIAATLSSGLFITGCAVSDDGHWGRSTLDVAPVTNATYKEECGSCHMAYQPGFLPARSWTKMMGDLENHFDENAELDAETQKQLTVYLTENAADYSDYKRSNAMMNSLRANDAPLRITGTRYFIRKHDELPKRMVANNPEVQSFSRCETCHTTANKGSYNEHKVLIPGYGSWED
ncbi:MAG: hypothetical protein ISEC1_P1297 [Thiomicrorhabdus sp.]|nr:MAG: hypothetical protein ISEC1_P1297 [Thiomicrorhabdus sp.]